MSNIESVTTRYEGGIVITEAEGSVQRVEVCNNYYGTKDELESQTEWYSKQLKLHTTAMRLAYPTEPTLKANRKTGKTTKVAQYKGTRLIAKFDSIGEASKAMGVSQGAISHAIKRKGTSAGFNWRKAR